MDQSERELQRRCERLVECEVIALATGLVERLINKHEPELLDDIDGLFQLVCPECGEPVPHDAENDETDAEGDWDGYRCALCETLIDVDECDSEPQEIYEWWIVTQWLADKLVEHGAPVIDDLYGSVVWGRTTTGQAIMLDGVIRDIQRELDKLAA